MAINWIYAVMPHVLVKRYHFFTGFAKVFLHKIFQQNFCEILSGSDLDLQAPASLTQDAYGSFKPVEI
ncbi:hypothetical protein [Diplocloster agilis]|uniref:hypothetical protein n=1 Tax=Diplocloster agilis TaxID=2850323 RepID=UPI003A7F1B4B